MDRSTTTTYHDVMGTLWFVFIGHGAPGQSGQDSVLVDVNASQTASGL